MGTQKVLEKQKQAQHKQDEHFQFLQHFSYTAAAAAYLLQGTVVLIFLGRLDPILPSA